MRPKIRTAAALLAVILAVSPLAAVSGAEHIPETSYVELTFEASSGKLAAPKNISTSAAYTSVTLTWSDVKGADAYRVYIYNSKTGKYDTAKTVSGTVASVDKLESGKKYKFVVAALVKSGGKYVAQTTSKAVSVETSSDSLLPAPSGVKITSAKTSIALTWNAVKGAAAYRVYKYDTSSGSYKKYQTVTGTKCTIRDLKAGQTYKFLIASLKKKGSSYSLQNKTSVITAATKASDGTTAIEITFDKLPKNLKEFKALPQAALSTPFDTAAMTVLALSYYPTNRELSMQMYEYLSGARTVSSIEKNFINDRFLDSDYIPRSYFEGAVPENGYRPTKPYTVIARDNPYSYDNNNYAKIYLTSGGAESPRYVTLRLAKDGKWYLWEQFILVSVADPTDTDPWA